MEVEVIQDKAGQAADFLKALASPHRLMILCQLTQGEKSVTDIIEATKIAQTSVSQHLNKLKQEGLVTYRREHRVLYYRIEHPAVLEVMEVMYRSFCQQAGLSEEHEEENK
jgi:DNA-binding transcriptional ArsR family regulator